MPSSTHQSHSRVKSLKGILSAEAWLTHPYLCWGVLPILAANVGYWVPALLLEALLVAVVEDVG